MSKAPNSDEFYEKLKGRLYETASWPSEYLYKFIVLTDKTKITTVETLFDNLGAVITTKASRNGKYTSISINVRMASPETVIEKYMEVAEKVEGVISL
jgi:putative lipoic acid-binding regulatory protein